MIQKRAKNAQFIVTTFKPELVEGADKWYGIKFSQGTNTSNIVPIDKADALRTIREVNTAIAYFALVVNVTPRRKEKEPLQITKPLSDKEGSDNEMEQKEPNAQEDHAASAESSEEDG